MSSISTNYIFNAALTVSSYAINLILFPYVTRVLGAEGIGQAGYVSECVNYFAVFSVLGIATVGTREIAACGQDLEKRSIVFSSLVSILMGTTGIVLFCICVRALLSLALFKTRICFYSDHLSLYPCHF